MESLSTIGSTLVISSILMCTGKNGHEILLTGESKHAKKTLQCRVQKKAARLMIIEGLSGSEVSEKLGVNTTMLYRWKSEHLEELEGDKRCQENASPKELAEEITRLRKQLAKSEEDREGVMFSKWEMLSNARDIDLCMQQVADLIRTTHERISGDQVFTPSFRGADTEMGKTLAD